MPYAIELRDVSYRYPNSEEWSLRHINLTVEKGKFVAVMGANGAGKTTLSLCLNGLIPQLTEGEMNGQVLVGGMDTGKFRVQTLARHVGLVLQDPEAQIFGRTVWEDVAFGPSNFVFPLAEIAAQGSNALQLVRLNNFEQRNTAELSGGEKQRLALAGILALTPDILVLDEPTAELDPLGRQELYALLDRLRREKDLTVIVVEHLTDEVMFRADEIVVLDKGEIVWQGLPGHLFADTSLVTRFGLRPAGVSHSDRTRTDAAITQESPEPDAKIEPVIELKGLTYGYDPVRSVLHGLDFKVLPGEFVALVGPNGAGKTTLAKHLNGLLKPGDGDVWVAGRNTKEHTVGELASTVGYLFQNPDHQIFAISVEKEIAYGLKNAGIDEKGINERIAEALRFTGLAEVRELHPFTLSRGNRQLLAIASILAMGPQILVIDEPTAGLDWTGVQKLMTLIRDLHRQGTTVIMISHDLDLVAEYAQRVVVMREGKVWRDGPVAELFADPLILNQAALVAPMGSGEVQGERTPKSVIPSVATGQPNLEPPHASIWRRLDVRTKVIVFSSMVVLACLFHNPVLNLILTAGIAMISGWSGVRLKRVAGVLLPLVPVFVLVLGVNAISFTHGLSGSYYLALTLSGIKRGITFVLRILMMVLATAFLAVSTPVDEIVQLLHKLRFPPSIAFVITTAIRFVPALDRRRTQILEAQKARGAKLEVKGIISPIRAYIPIMVPLLIYSITVANSLAMAMLDRGFGFAKEVTQLGETAFAGRDYMLLGLTVIVLGGFIYAGLILRMGR